MLETRFPRDFARIEAGRCPTCDASEVQIVEVEGALWLRCGPCNGRRSETEGQVFVRLRPAADTELFETGSPIIEYRYPEAVPPPPVDGVAHGVTTRSLHGYPGTLGPQSVWCARFDGPGEG